MQKLFLLLMAAVLVGCASLKENNADARLIVQYSTLKVCDTAERAARCAEIAGEVQRYANDTAQLTVSALMFAIEEQIDWTSLDAADALLVRTLTERLRAELVERLGEDVLPEDLRLAATTVADWVIDASALVR